jgi:UDP-4-amino-4,6-dideoxy-N-acetyl-beta-L-altrosamine N-acetyltransferase
VSTPDINLGSIRPMLMSDLTMILAWRNHIDVRQYMYTQHEISLDEHIEWFEEVLLDSSKNCLIFEYNGVPTGFVSLNLRDTCSFADWGFYVAPLTKKGIGKLLGVSALNYAFNELKLRKVYGQAIAYNERSIAFHSRLGFVIEGKMPEPYFDGTNFHDVICFGLMADEWEEGI